MNWNLNVKTEHKMCLLCGLVSHCQSNQLLVPSSSRAASLNPWRHLVRSTATSPLLPLLHAQG